MRRFKFETPDGHMTALEFGDPATRLAALWLHATGFNAMTYQSLLAPLGLRTKIHALDLRGHGRTELPTNPRKMKSWNQHRDDVIAFLDREAPANKVVLGGHSMGATVALLAAAARPEKVAGLVLADPVILKPSIYRWAHLMPFMRHKSPMVTQAKRRRSDFASTDEVFESYKNREAFKNWREPFLSDYILDGFDRTDDGEPDAEEQTWSLLCRPEFEAATFAAQRNRPWRALSIIRKKKIPITVLRPAYDSVMTKKVVERLIRKVPAAIVKDCPNTGHFLPMEAPYAVRDQLSQFISNLIEGMDATETNALPRSLQP